MGEYIGNIISLSASISLDQYVDRFVDIIAGEEYWCVECGAYPVEDINFAYDCEMPVQCFVDPCMGVECEEECFADYCGGCYGDCILSEEDDCVDFTGIDFGMCDMFLGYGWTENGCIGISGCGWDNNGIDYSDFFFNSFSECDSACSEIPEGCDDGEIEFWDTCYSIESTIVLNNPNEFSTEFPIEICELINLEILDLDVIWGNSNFLMGEIPECIGDLVNLEELLEEAKYGPSVNQIEIHLWLQRPSLIKATRESGAVPMAYSPLARGQKINDENRKIFEDLLYLLKNIDKKLTSEEIQTQIYNIGKKHNFSNLRDFFILIYQVLLGQNQGPRLGSFIKMYGINNTCKLINRALTGQDLIN